MPNGNTYLIQVSESMSFQGEFSERLQFNQLYDFIKKNKMYVFNKDISHNSCVCETCKNATLLGRGINLSCQKKVPTNAHELVETYACDSNDADCMTGECDTCLAADLITDDLCGEEKDSEGNDTDDENKLVSFRMWAKEDGAPRKISVSMEVDDVKKLYKASRCTYTRNDVKYMLTMKTKPVLKKVRYYSTSILVKATKIKGRMKFSQHTLANIVSAFLPFVDIF